MRITAGGEILREKRILLGLRRAGGAYYAGVWDVFGGHCEADETPQQAITRELHEELGIVPEGPVLLGVYDEPDPTRYGEGRHYFFLIERWRGEPANLGDEHEQIRWFTWDELHTVELAAQEYLDLFAGLLHGGD